MSQNPIAIVDETTFDEPQTLTFAVGKKSNVIYSSRQAVTEEEKTVLINALIRPELRVADFINQIIHLKDIHIEQIQMPDQKTGEMRDLPRVLLWDKDGRTYGATSFGIFTALKTIVNVKGTPDTWTKPLAVKVKQITSGKNNLLTLEVVAVKE